MTCEPPDGTSCEGRRTLWHVAAPPPWGVYRLTSIDLRLPLFSLTPSSRLVRATAGQVRRLTRSALVSGKEETLPPPYGLWPMRYIIIDIFGIRQTQ